MYLLRKLCNSGKTEKVVISNISTGKTNSWDTTWSYVGFFFFFFFLIVILTSFNCQLKSTKKVEFEKTYFH